MRSLSPLLLCFALLTAGCAAIERTDVAEEREYQTGSRLPKRDYDQPSQVLAPGASDMPGKPLPGPRPSGG